MKHELTTDTSESATSRRFASFRRVREYPILQYTVCSVSGWISRVEVDNHFNEGSNVSRVPRGTLQKATMYGIRKVTTQY